MTQEIKKPTALETALMAIKEEAKYVDIVNTAAKLDIAQSTVYDYLNGNVAKESRGKNILDEMRRQIIKRSRMIA